MAGVDSLLRMLEQHGADELRLGTDQAPRMLQRGAPVRLSIPPTSDAMLQHLVEPLLTPERQAALRDAGRVQMSYAPEGGGSNFAVTFERRGSGATAAFDVTFRKAIAPPPPSAAIAPPPLHGATATAAMTATPATPATPTAPAATTATPGATASPATTASAARASATAAIGGPAPATASIAPLLRQAITLGASDLHLWSGDPPMVRVDGRLRALSSSPAIGPEELVASLAPEQRASLDAGHSIDLALVVDGVGRFRVNLYRASGRLAAAIRVVVAVARSLDELGFPLPLGDLVDAPHGLVIVCGPTGSGKSATLAALAAEAVRRRPGLLITLEDPIEYTIGGGGLVRQRQIGSDVADFATGLRDALREDPDILLIGEMRDPETISLALTAAETGHLVLTSLHSRSAPSTIERIVDAYAPARQHQIRIQLADTLRAVVAQRLLPRAVGAGRLPAVEILRANHGVASLIREGKTAQLTSVLQSSRKEGMIPLERCLADLVRSGQISRADATTAANDTASLASYLQG
jgi:twitching motility protein PilT